MSKVLFTINYEIDSEKREEYLRTIRELKNLIRTEGLESYSVYIFSSNETFEAFDDDTDERINILITKISGMTVDHSTKYTTSLELL